ncbi:MAG: hypothetical protein AAFQ13_13275 [Pseudomonadota bacterium]
MDYGTKATLRSGIVDRNRYANDPIYRETIRRHNPMAEPTRLKQFDPEYYAQNRAEFAEFLVELIRWAFVGLTLLALAFVLAAITMAEMPTNAPDLNAASYIGLGAAGLAGVVYAAAARRAEKLGILGLISKTGQGASLAACVILMPIFVFMSFWVLPADPVADAQAFAIAAACMVAGLALTLSYKRWMLTGAFAFYAAVFVGAAFVPALI